MCAYTIFPLDCDKSGPLDLKRNEKLRIENNFTHQ